MQPTGERYVPSLHGQIEYEHLHRYALCIKYVTGKSILDIASGEGYGSALLSRFAQSVVGVDIDAKAVEYATQKYSSYHNLHFLVGACHTIPLPDNSVEIVTSFETIEHHAQHEEMMLEIKRVLKPNGLLIISSPNRLTYSDEPKYCNPFHVKKLYYQETQELFSHHFQYSKIFGQKIAIGYFIFDLDNSSGSVWKAYTGGLSNFKQQVCSLESPVYFVALCSDNLDWTNQSLDSIYMDSNNDLLKETYLELQQSNLQLQHTQVELQQSNLQLQHTQVELQHWQSSKLWRFWGYGCN